MSRRRRNKKQSIEQASNLTYGLDYDESPEFDEEFMSDYEYEEAYNEYTTRLFAKGIKWGVVLSIVVGVLFLLWGLDGDDVKTDEIMGFLIWCLLFGGGFVALFACFSFNTSEDNSLSAGFMAGGTLTALIGFVLGALEFAITGGH